MIPAKSGPVWRSLVTGRISIQSSMVAFNMLICTCKMHVRHDGSPATIDKLALDAFEFFTKYEKLLEPELKQLKSSSSLSDGGRANAATDFGG